MRMAMTVVPALGRANRTIGAILMDSGLLSVEGAQRVLIVQRQHKLRFGEAAIQLGLVTEADVQFALARQFEYAYLRPNDGKSSKSAVSDEVIAAYQPFSPRVDELRAVRSQLMLRWLDKAEQRQMFAVVGTEKGEGRSYLAANLAVVFAQMGERTLLLDADLRSPRQHELFGLQNKLGLSSVLAGHAREEAIVRITDLAGLFVLPSGPVPPNPLELLGKKAFAQVLANSRANFDVVIIDTPGLHSGEDAFMISASAGAALAVARSARTRVGVFSEMLEGLANSGVSVVGSVLNDASTAPQKKKR